MRAFLPGTALALLVISGGGCGEAWRPPNVQKDPPRLQTQPTLVECLQADRLGRRVYERRDYPLRKDPSTSEYPRLHCPDRIQEGMLADRSYLPLDRYLQDPDDRSSDEQRPRLSFGRLMTIFFELAEPLPTMPPELELNNPIRSSTSIRYFDHRGRSSMLGTVTREAEIEGYETVESPAGHFENCLRVRVDLKVHFPWTLVADLKHVVWLSPQVGEVRRLQNMRGWFLIFWFGSTQEYRLVSYSDHPETGESDQVSADVAPEWKRGLVVFDRGYPSLRIGGMVVDLAEESREP